MMISFADHIPAFIPPSCFIALGRNDTVTHMSLANLYRFILNRFNVKEALQGEKARPLWNPIVNKGLEVEDQRLRRSSMTQYVLSSQLLMFHLVNDARELMDGIWRAKQASWMGWAMALGELTERGSHLLWLLATAGCSLLSKRNVMLRLK